MREPLVHTVRRCLVVIVLCSCGGRDGGGDREPAATGAPASRGDITQMLRSDAVGEPHASDGGGRVWLETQEPAVVHAGERGRWSFVYEAGPLGIAAGGTILLQVSPFWGWSTPQVEDPAQPGFTTVALELAPRGARARRRRRHRQPR